jgi:hypothetical protein
MDFVELNSIESTGGAVTNDSLGVALAITGVGVTGGWGVVSTIHTFISSPIISTVSLVGGSGALVAGANMMKDKYSFDLKRKPVDVEAQPA